MIRKHHIRLSFQWSHKAISVILMILTMIYRCHIIHLELFDEETNVIIIIIALDLAIRNGTSRWETDESKLVPIDSCRCNTLASIEQSTNPICLTLYHQSNVMNYQRVIITHLYFRFMLIILQLRIRCYCMHNNVWTFALSVWQIVEF